uniref:Uncharacterized protein n=1 Tax=uncultured prokaryote TaxID=198431 RepID=A0A0H5Q5F2_9ZZZZ|nr:hypothetical protein [uncultured prokaryote]
MAVRCHVTIGGAIADTSTPSLNWSVNYQFGATTALGSADATTMADAVLTDIAADSDVLAGLGTHNQYGYVRVAFHDPDSGPETSVGLSTGSPVNGSTATTSPPPPQVCAVATLRTGIPGRSFRGRLYWPATAFGVQANGIMATASTKLSPAVQGIAQYCAVEAADLGSNLAWYVWSPTKKVGTPVTVVSVGARCDTQRRRNEADDTYTNFPVT